MSVGLCSRFNRHLILLLHAALATVAMELPNCDPMEIGACNSSNLLCNENTRRCECLGHLHFNKHSEALDAACVEELPTDVLSTPSESNHATTVIVVLFFIGLIVSGLVLAVRRYNLIHWFRQKIISRRDNNVMYEDVMIGQDDPPIAA
ncbi:uncharacterized protein LOC143921071 [Arctopsyche grandis]|uniref:uncharacterized protein LOC143921071 n=1 Tax=Arctopsyche grandis TaxID=121162 RepID=UPI00406D8288